MASRTLYLVRHGHVDFPDGIRRCIGRTDLPLDTSGFRQAAALGKYFSDIERDKAGADNRAPARYTVYSSPLKRARETAEILSNGRWPVYTEPDLQELYMGEWENVPLKDLKKTLSSEPIYGETRKDGAARFEQAVANILRQTSGDVICVAHAGINCCFLSGLSGTPLAVSRALPQPYGGFSRIQVTGGPADGREGKAAYLVWEAKDGRHMDGWNMEIQELGRMPQEVPDDQACEEIWNHYHTPENVRAHCRAVCRQAEEIAGRLRGSGINLDTGMIRSAALLHDVARVKKNHEEEGAAWVRREGYPKIAEIIRHHSSIGEKRGGALPDETDVVYLADKQVCGTETIDLEARFLAKKLQLQQIEQEDRRREALAAWEIRFNEALAVQDRVSQYMDWTEGH